jgi:ankyrin repeat protein
VVGAYGDIAVPGDGSPLIMAAREGFRDIARMLIERGADVNLAVAGDGNPLIMAAREGYLEIARMLLDRGALVNEVVPGDENAIINASGAGYLEIVKLLVSRGADVNSRVWVERGWPDPRGQWRTPLGRARENRHTEVVRYLQSVGAVD